MLLLEAVVDESVRCVDWVLILTTLRIQTQDRVKLPVAGRSRIQNHVALQSD